MGVAGQGARSKSAAPITRNRACETATLGPCCSDDRDGLRCHGGRPCSAVTLLRNAGENNPTGAGLVIDATRRPTLGCQVSIYTACPGNEEPDCNVSDHGERSKLR